MRTRDSLALACAGLLSSCRLIHPVRSEPPLPIALPASYREDLPEDRSTGGANIDGWWREFGDPVLARLIERALEKNLDLEILNHRAYQTARTATPPSPYLPEVGLNVGAGRVRRVLFLGDEEPVVFESNDLFADLGASLELDVWGRLIESHDALEDRGRIARLDVEAYANDLVAAVADAWFRVVGMGVQRRLAFEAVADHERLLGVVRARFEQRLAAHADVIQEERELQIAQTEIVAIDEELLRSRSRLASLLSVTSHELDVPDESELPAPPPLPKLGVPADLVLRRPEVRRARMMITEADHRLASAVADLFPRLRISGTLGLAAQDPRQLVKGWNYSAAVQLEVPILDGFARIDEVARLESAVDEGGANYARTLLAALREVEEAVAVDRLRAELVERGETEVVISSRAHRVALDLFQRGVDDYLRVRTTLLELDSSRRRLADARRRRLSQRVRLLRALGGGWTASVARSDR